MTITFYFKPLDKCITKPITSIVFGDKQALVHNGDNHFYVPVKNIIEVK